MLSRRWISIAWLWLVIASLPAAAQTRRDSVPATAQDSNFEATVRDVAASLRCPVCQNLSIQDSPSKLAQDMKRVVRDRLASGETPEQVRRYFVSRYGEWVLLKPRARGVNLSVWLLPLVALLGGATIVWTAVQRWVRQGATARGPGPADAPASTPSPSDALDPAELRARKAALVASLEELEAEFAAGRLASADLAMLRQRDEAELAAVNAAVNELKKTHVSEQRDNPVAEPVTRARRVSPAVGWSTGILAFAVVVVLSLRGAVVSRPAGGTITGTQRGGAAPLGDTASDPGLSPIDSLRLTQLERRVRADSSDQAALIELGHIYLLQGRLKKSADVDMKAVQLQPDAESSAEAFAHLGMILWSTGEVQTALKSLDKALYLHPDFPEALLYKGIILFAGVRDMKRAAEVLQRYLDVAPADANTARVKGMLEAARQASRP